MIEVIESSCAGSGIFGPALGVARNLIEQEAAANSKVSFAGECEQHSTPSSAATRQGFAGQQSLGQHSRSLDGGTGSQSKSERLLRPPRHNALNTSHSTTGTKPFNMCSLAATASSHSQLAACQTAEHPPPESMTCTDQHWSQSAAERSSHRSGGSSASTSLRLRPMFNTHNGEHAPLVKPAPKATAQPAVISERWWQDPVQIFNVAATPSAAIPSSMLRRNSVPIDLPSEPSTPDSQPQNEIRQLLPLFADASLAAKLVSTTAASPLACSYASKKGLARVSPAEEPDSMRRTTVAVPNFDLLQRFKSSRQPADAVGKTEQSEAQPKAPSPAGGLRALQTVATSNPSEQEQRQQQHAQTCTSTDDEPAEMLTMLPEEIEAWTIPMRDVFLANRIGCGAYSRVYRARWHCMDVAVKQLVPSKELAASCLVREFGHELGIMQALRHPNVVKLVGACVARPDNLCIVTQLMPRGSLYRLLQTPNLCLDMVRRLTMALQTARGLQYLHSRSPPILHLDLKSPNLLVDIDYTIKVADFGLSKLQVSKWLHSKLSGGTPEWTAPEVMLGQPVNHKSDVFSFGIVLWELLTGLVPWAGKRSVQVVGLVAYSGRRLAVPEDVDPELACLIRRCCLAETDARPELTEIIEVLEAHLERAKLASHNRERDLPTRVSGGRVLEGETEWAGSAGPAVKGSGFGASDRSRSLGADGTGGSGAAGGSSGEWFGASQSAAAGFAARSAGCKATAAAAAVWASIAEPTTACLEAQKASLGKACLGAPIT